jgi:hypothetical protein
MQTNVKIYHAMTVQYPDIRTEDIMPKLTKTNIEDNNKL